MSPPQLLLCLVALCLVALSFAQNDCGRPYTKARATISNAPRNFNNARRTLSNTRRTFSNERRTFNTGDRDRSGERRTSRDRRQVNPPIANVPLPGPAPAPYSSCGATPISDRFLVTAAYCVMDEANPITSVRLGDLDVSQEGEPNSRPADYDIELILLHPNFTHSPETQIRYNDLALLKTTRKIEFNEAVFPYCISPGRPAPGTTVIASGFGYVNETHKPTHLQEGELQVMNPTECEALYRSRGKENLLKSAYPNLLQGAGVLCAGHPGRGACKGDEGGPLLREDASGRRFLEGVISFTGDTCGPNVLPSVSVSIADHYNFIFETLRTS